MGAGCYGDGGGKHWNPQKSHIFWFLLQNWSKGNPQFIILKSNLLLSAQFYFYLFNSGSISNFFRFKLFFLYISSHLLFSLSLVFSFNLIIYFIFYYFKRFFLFVANYFITKAGLDSKIGHAPSLAPELERKQQIFIIAVPQLTTGVRREQFHSLLR